MSHKNDESDPDFLAMTLYMTVILHESIELAGVIRDLVYEKLTNNPKIVPIMIKMFEAAADKAAVTPHLTDKSFLESLNAASHIKDPAAIAINDIVYEEVSDWMIRLPHFGINQVSAEAFVASSPQKADVLATGRVEQSYLKELHAIFMSHIKKGLVDWPPQGRAKKVFAQASKAAGSRAARMALADCGNAYAVAAAAQAVLVEQTTPKPKKFLQNKAPDICDELCVEMSKVGVSREWASELTKEMLDGARMYPYDGAEACGETAVRALRAANNRAADTAARTAFSITYSLAISCAWRVALDKDRFESLHNRALSVAARMDRAIFCAFDQFESLTGSDAVDDPLDTWSIFLSASKLTVSEWAQIAQTIDYRATALAAENAPLIELYVKEYGIEPKSFNVQSEFVSDKQMYMHKDDDDDSKIAH